MNEKRDAIVSVGGIRADIGSDGRLVFLSKSGVSDTLWLPTEAKEA